MSLLREFGILPYQITYARLCARLWNNCRDRVNLESKTLYSDILLFKAGCDTCWSAKFLKCMIDINVLEYHSIHTLRSLDARSISQLTFHEDDIITKFSNLYTKFWSLTRQYPRTAPSQGAAFTKYCSWHLDPGSHSGNRLTKPHNHITTIIPTNEVKPLLRFRLNSCQLNCNDHSLPRVDRVCTLSQYALY